MFGGIKASDQCFQLYAKRILHNNSYNIYHYLFRPFFVFIPLRINNNNLSTICKHSIGHSISSRFSHRFVLYCLHLRWLGYYLFQVTGGGSSIVTILGSLFSVGAGGDGTGGTGGGSGV